MAIGFRIAAILVQLTIEYEARCWIEYIRRHGCSSSGVRPGQRWIDFIIKVIAQQVPPLL